MLSNSYSRIDWGKIKLRLSLKSGLKERQKSWAIDYSSQLNSLSENIKLKIYFDYKDVSFPQWLTALILVVTLSHHDFCSYTFNQFCGFSKGQLIS